METREKEQIYGELKQKIQEVADLKFAAGVLQWDQETYMPPSGAAARGRQVATLTEMAHNLFVSPTVQQLMAELENTDGLPEDAIHNIRLLREDLEKSKKIPASLIREISETVSAAFHAWVKARKENDFSIFQPSMEKLVALKQREAEYLGYESHPYNALLNDYEKGSTVALIDEVFEGLKEPLHELIQKIAGGPQVGNEFLHRHFPKQEQWDYGMELLQELGYDLEAGRQDIAMHPFSISFSAKDVRITTRIDENDLGNMVWSTIHELGHALYEQGLPDEQYGMPLGEAASLSIHESQSRLWENNLGRSRAFWENRYTLLQKIFPRQLGNIGIEAFYKGVNQVKPSFIRTEADELTYHFHVMIRYELEKRLIAGELKVADVPAFWNEQYKKWLGVVVPDDKTGCLQDVHWSHGSFGYFPTYSLGSLYAAQFFSKAQEDIPGLNEKIAAGDTSEILDWLRKNIHAEGRKYSSAALCEKVTGQPLSSEYFMKYVRNKYAGIYNITP